MPRVGSRNWHPECQFKIFQTEQITKTLILAFEVIVQPLVHALFNVLFFIFGPQCSFLAAAADGRIAKLFKSRFSFTRLLDGTVSYH